MSKNKKNRKLSHETTLFAIGTTLFIIFIAVIIFSFIFIINDILPAITSRDSGEGGSEAFFNLEGFEEIGL